MNQTSNTVERKEYAAPEIHMIDFKFVLPFAGSSVGDVEGENSGLDKPMETDGDFDD